MKKKRNTSDKREKLAEQIKKAKEAVDQANAALDDLIGELDDETLSAVTGGTGGNPYEDTDRVPDKKIRPDNRPSFLPQDQPSISRSVGGNRNETK